MKKKIVLLIIRIKFPGQPVKIIEAKKKNGWSQAGIRRFVAGVKSGHPNARITTSTVSEKQD